MTNLSVMIAALALLGAACSDSATKKGMPNDSGNKDGGGSGGANNGVTIPDAGGGEKLPFPTCDRDNVPSYPENEAPLVWTEAEFDACAAACPDFDSPCLSEKCPNAEAFSDCIDDNLLACLSSDGGDCNTEWETYVCCTDIHCFDTDVAEAELETCIDTNCSSEVAKFKTCVDDELESRSTLRNRCIAPSVTACLKPTDDAGVSGDAGTGTMMTKSLNIGRSARDAVLHRARLGARFTHRAR